MSARRVLFFGDDVVAGVGDVSSLGLVGRLASAAFAAHRPIVTYNLGVIGDTSVGVSRRWRREAAPRVVDAEPWSPVFCMGANDTQEHAGRGRVDVLASVQALQKVLARALDTGLVPLIIGPPPLGDRPQRERTMALSERFREMCEQYEVAYCDTAIGLVSSPHWVADLGPNGGPPSEAGYEELAKVVAAETWPSWLASLEVRQLAVRRSR